MSYDYSTERPFVFTEEGQVMFLQIRDHVARLLETAGAFQMERAFDGVKGSYSSWGALACVDRLVELGEIRELPQRDPAGQHRTFVNARP